MAIFFRDKIKNRNRKILVSLFGSIIFFLFIFPLIFRGAATRIGFGFWKTGTVLGNSIESVRAFFTRNESLYRENELLKKQVSDFMLQEKFSIEKENSTLKAPLVTIVAKPFATGNDVIVVAHAISDKEKYINTIVTTEAGIPLGVVDFASDKLMYIKLFSYSGNQITLREKDSGIDFSLVGRSSGNFYLEANQDVPITTGAFLYLPGVDMFPVAQITKVVSREHDPEKVYLATFVINYNTLDVLQLTEIPYAPSN